MSYYRSAESWTELWTRCLRKRKALRRDPKKPTANEVKTENYIASQIRKWQRKKSQVNRDVKQALVKIEPCLFESEADSPKIEHVIKTIEERETCRTKQNASQLKSQESFFARSWRNI